MSFQPEYKITVHFGSLDGKGLSNDVLDRFSSTITQVVRDLGVTDEDVWTTRDAIECKTYYYPDRE